MNCSWRHARAPVERDGDPGRLDDVGDPLAVQGAAWSRTCRGRCRWRERTRRRRSPARSRPRSRATGRSAASSPVISSVALEALDLALDVGPVAARLGDDLDALAACSPPPTASRRRTAPSSSPWSRHSADDVALRAVVEVERDGHRDVLRHRAPHRDTSRRRRSSFTVLTEVWTISGARSSSAAARTASHRQVVDDVDRRDAVALGEGAAQDLPGGDDRHDGTSTVQGRGLGSWRGLERGSARCCSSTISTSTTPARRTPRIASGFSCSLTTATTVSMPRRSSIERPISRAVSGDEQGAVDVDVVAQHVADGAGVAQPGDLLDATRSRCGPSCNRRRCRRCRRARRLARGRGAQRVGDGLLLEQLVAHLRRSRRTRARTGSRRGRRSAPPALRADLVGVGRGVHARRAAHRAHERDVQAAGRPEEARAPRRCPGRG